MKHLKHLFHSNEKSYLRCWQNQTMKKRILQLTGARREYLYTHIKSHWKTPLTPTQFPESHQAQTFPIGSLKVQFSHRNICQYWRNIIWCSVHTHLHSHHRSHKQIISQPFIGVLAKIPSRIMSFSAEKQKAKNPNLYQSFWSDWHNRTLDRKPVSEIQRSTVFKQSETHKEKVHRLVCVDARAQNV